MNKIKHPQAKLVNVNLTKFHEHLTAILEKKKQTLLLVSLNLPKFFN